MPRVYTADGQELPPPLMIESVPPRTRSLALVVDDLDAPDPRTPERGGFVQWLVYELPPNTREFDMTVSGLPPGAKEGINGMDRQRYAGPKPQVGRHRYRFTLYALDAVVGNDEPLSKQKLERRMAGHVIESAELVGTYATGDVGEL